MKIDWDKVWLDYGVWTNEKYPYLDSPCPELQYSFFHKVQELVGAQMKDLKQSNIGAEHCDSYTTDGTQVRPHKCPVCDGKGIVWVRKNNQIVSSLDIKSKNNE